METNFFSQLDPVMDGSDIQLTIKKKDGKLTVGVFATPRIDDDARKHIPPLSFIATATELDEHFFTQIQKPLESVSGWSLDMKEFEKGMAKAEAESQRARKKEEAERKKKDEMKKLLDKAKPLMEDNKARQAIPLINKALSILPDHTNANAMLKQARTKAGMGEDLFASTESVPPASVEEPSTEASSKTDVAKSKEPSNISESNKS